MGSVIRVYVDDEIHASLKSISESRNSTITQVAGQVLKECILRREELEKLTLLLEKVIEVEQRSLSCLMGLEEGIDILLVSIAKTNMLLGKNFRSVDVDSEELLKRVEMARDRIRKAKEKV